MVKCVPTDRKERRSRKQEAWMQPAQTAMPRLGSPTLQNGDTPEIATKHVALTLIQHICEHGPIRNDHHPPFGVFICTVPNRTSHPSEGLRQGLHPLKNLA